MVFLVGVRSSVPDWFGFSVERDPCSDCGGLERRGM